MAARRFTSLSEEIILKEKKAVIEFSFRRK